MRRVSPSTLFKAEQRSLLPGIATFMDPGDVMEHPLMNGGSRILYFQSGESAKKESIFNSKIKFGVNNFVCL